MGFSLNDYSREKFNRLAITGTTVTSKIFEDCEFTACSFVDCRLADCRFLGCKFIECIFSAVVPMNCRFNDVSFNSCKVIGIDWTKTGQVHDLAFVECQLNYSSFKLLAIPKTKIVKCEAKEVDFTETDLSHSDLKDTDFDQSRFFKTNLSYADFKGAKNYFIDVRTNTLKQTRFSLPEALSLLHSLDIVLD